MCRGGKPDGPLGREWREMLQSWGRIAREQGKQASCLAGYILFQVCWVLNNYLNLWNWGMCLLTPGVSGALTQGWAPSEVACLPWLGVSNQCRIGLFRSFIARIHACTGFITKKSIACRIFKILRYADSSSCMEISRGILWLIFICCFFSSLYFFSFTRFNYCFRTGLRFKKKQRNNCSNTRDITRLLVSVSFHPWPPL